MMKKLVIIAIILSISKLLFGQDSYAKVENIRLDVKQDKLIIHYDLIASDLLSFHHISVFFSDDLLSNRSYPIHIQGDVGDSIVPGYDKLITWSLVTDRADMNFPLYCNIVVDGHLGDIKSGGPSNALLSLAIPGLGDYFVADSENMKFKPWQRTASSLGMVALGGMALNQREELYRFVPGHLEIIYSPYGSVSHEIWIPDKWVRNGTKHFLFQDDAELFFGIGAAIWLMDIIWVMNKGMQNDNINELMSDGGFDIQPMLACSNGLIYTGIRIQF